MAIEEIPLDQPETIEEKEESAEIIQENVEENTEKNQEEIIENQENHKVEEKIEPAPKKRGRPKGSMKPKEEKPVKEKPTPKEKPKKVAKAKPQKKKVQIESESSEEELPAYVRQQMPERDLATQMMQLLQNHSNLAAQRKKQIYASWIHRF